MLAQAVQRINPQANLGIGPPITDGFYYDFGVAAAVHARGPQGHRQGDGSASSARASASSAGSSPTRRRAPSSPTSRSSSSSSGSRAAPKEAAEGASVEVGAGELTIYDNVNRDGETVWKDLCRGPHLPSTRMIGNGWALTRVAGAYWRGSEKNPQLQRIYGTAWPTKDELRAYQQRLEEAAKRDHRKLGRELDLFSFPDEIGSGLSVWHPRGGIVRGRWSSTRCRRHIARRATPTCTRRTSRSRICSSSPTTS